MSDDEADLAAWDHRTHEALRTAYLDGGAGPRGSGVSVSSEGEWRARRQHLVGPMDDDGDWLDIGCANGHLLTTLPTWAAERGVRIEPHGLELIADLAGAARRLCPDLAERIWTGSVMTWTPPRRFRWVTALDDAVPPDRLGDLVARLLSEYVASNGRLILSSYTNSGDAPRDLSGDVVRAGYVPDGVIRIDRPSAHPLQTVWIDAAQSGSPAVG